MAGRSIVIGSGGLGRMRHRASVTGVALVCLLLLSLLTSCMGDGDDDDATVTPTSTSVASGATPPASTDAATTSAVPDATVASAASPTAVPTSVTDDMTDDEQALVLWLLTSGDLGEEWAQTRLAASREAPATSVCNADAYVPPSGLPPSVEIEYESTDLTRFIAETVSGMQDTEAIDAMAALRESATCGEWTDDAGVTYTLEPRVAPAVGDEALAVKISFTVGDSSTLEGDIVWFRRAGVVVSLSHLQVGGYDAQAADTVALIADSRAAVQSGALEPTPLEAALIAGLLNVDNLSADWDQLEAARATSADRWTQLCGAGTHPQAAQAQARVTVSMSQGFDALSASLQELLVAYPGGTGDEAFDWERDAISCASFVQVTTPVTLTPVSYPNGLADAVAAVEFSYEEGSRTISGHWVVVRVGDLVATLVYTAPAGIDGDVIESIITVAAQKMRAVSLP